MSYWSHNPELLDEIIAAELLDRAWNAPGECIINFVWIEEVISYDWIEKKFGIAFAHSITVDAERNYWEGKL